MEGILLRVKEILGIYIRTNVDPLEVNLGDTVTSKKNNFYREGLVKSITLRGVDIVGGGHRGTESVKWVDIIEVKKRN